MRKTPLKERPVRAPENLFSPGPKSRALVESEAPFMTPGLQSVALFSGLAFESGRGCVLKDADGREYLDFMAGVCVASIGHAHPE